MLYYDRIDISEGIDVAKSNNSEECITFNYCFLIMFFITVKEFDYSCITHDINKSEAIHSIENSVLEDCGYI